MKDFFPMDFWKKKKPAKILMETEFVNQGKYFLVNIIFQSMNMGCLFTYLSFQLLSVVFCTSLPKVSGLLG